MDLSDERWNGFHISCIWQQLEKRWRVVFGWGLMSERTDPPKRVPTPAIVLVSNANPPQLIEYRPPEVGSQGFGLTEFVAKAIEIVKRNQGN